MQRGKAKERKGKRRRETGRRRGGETEREKTEANDALVRTVPLEFRVLAGYQFDQLEPLAWEYGVRGK